MLFAQDSGGLPPLVPLPHRGPPQGISDSLARGLRGCAAARLCPGWGELGGGPGGWPRASWGLAGARRGEAAEPAKRGTLAFSLRTNIKFATAVALPGRAVSAKVLPNAHARCCRCAQPTLSVLRLLSRVLLALCGLNMKWRCHMKAPINSLTLHLSRHSHSMKQTKIFFST